MHPSGPEPLPARSSEVDPVTLELVRNAVDGIVDEMVLTIVRTAYSGVIKSLMDFSTAFCDPAGRMVAQGLTLPLHLGSIPDAMAAVLERYGDSVAPGDVFIMNDPFAGGMHLPDIFVFQPVFFEERLLGYAATVCHHTDVGGRVAGSNASDSTEVYQEGLRIPPLRLYRQGRPDESLFRLIEANVRMPVRVLGDLRAQLAACHVAERELGQLAARYGCERLLEYFEALMDYAERRTRAEIARWPDGTYTFTDYLDDDGFGSEPLPIRVALTVDGDEIEVDFSGSAPQAKGAINATLSFTKAAVYACVKYLLGPDIPNNEGFFRPIRVVAPPGTIVNCVHPAATAARGVTGFRIGDAVFGALAQVHPDRVFAAGEGGNTGVSIGGYDRERRPFVFVDFVCSSWGARPFADGPDGNTNPFENLANEPIEMTELEQPLRIERYGFIPDSGGAGRFRGGLGLVKEYRLLADEAVLQVRSDRRRFRPYGLAGGKPGASSLNIYNPGPNQEELPSKFTRLMQRGDVFRHLQPGGGGHGDPLERDPQLVLRDVLNEKVSREAAERDYGVVLSADGRTVDVAATQKLRQARRRPAG